MTDTPILVAIGLMSGTSLDGVDGALIETDGETVTALRAFVSRPYPAALRASLRASLGTAGRTAEVEAEMTRFHALVVEETLAAAATLAADVDIIGFHGHTVFHDPAHRRTVQIGDGALLAELAGIDVVDDFRSADVAEGGQGAPLAPLFHAALARDLEPPLAIVNVGGVANVTWIGTGENLAAFDTGPGNALIDDRMARRGAAYDANGALAASGHVDEGILAGLLDDPYFDRPPPKSLDRDAWDIAALDSLADADAVATLTAFTAASVARAAERMALPPRRWLITGGGRHNATLMRMLRERVAGPVEPVETVGWQGDAIEAQAFAFLAVRSLYGKPLTIPETTGVPRPLSGGRLHRKAAPAA